MVEELELEGDVESSKQLLESFKRYIEHCFFNVRYSVYVHDGEYPDAWLFIYNNGIIDIYFFDPYGGIYYFNSFEKVYQLRGKTDAEIAKNLATRGCDDKVHYRRVDLRGLIEWGKKNGFEESIIRAILKINPRQTYNLRHEVDRRELENLKKRIKLSDFLP